MSEMEWPQVLNEWRKAGKCFRNTPMLLDVQTPFHDAMKTNALRKPFLPLCASEHSHLQCLWFQSFQQRWDLLEVCFGNTDTEFVPAWTFWRNPLIGQNHRHAAHSHGIEQAHAGGANAARTKNKFARFANVCITPPIIAHGHGVQFAPQHTGVFSGGVLKQRSRMR